MRILRIMALAFAAGVVLAACENPNAVRCTVTGVDTLRVPSSLGTDTLTVIVRTEWCG